MFIISDIRLKISSALQSEKMERSTNTHKYLKRKCMIHIFILCLFLPRGGHAKGLTINENNIIKKKIQSCRIII